jgi:hypothetical protein
LPIKTYKGNGDVVIGAQSRGNIIAKSAADDVNCIIIAPFNFCASFDKREAAAMVKNRMRLRFRSNIFHESCKLFVEFE